MGQLTLYLDPETEAQLKRAAASSGLSMSKWAARAIREKAGEEWPPAVRELAGAWSDFADLREIREGTRDDLPREPL
jgi:DNA-binding NtrC family response regulator